MRSRAEYRGMCPRCRYWGPLSKSGTMFRHYANFLAQRWDIWPGGTCKGWGSDPMPGTTEPNT